MTSHIVFDSSYVSDTWDWFGSILFVMDQELWYDPTLGHNHLREFFSIGWPLCWGILFSVDDGFLSHVNSSEDIRCPFSTLEHETWLTHFVWCTLHRGIPLSIDDGFFGITVPWRRLVSFHIGVRDMIGWFLWCDHRSITFSTLLTCFWDDWIRTQTLMRACSRV